MSETVQESDQTTPAPEGHSETDASAEQEGVEQEASNTEALLVREGDIAGDYLERLLDLLDYDGDIDLDVEGSRAVINIEGGDDLEPLVGNRGQVLESLQDLTRLAVQQDTGVRSRLMLDVAGWRSRRRSELVEMGRSNADSARETGKAVRLKPMTPFERKIVHDAVAEIDGVHSESEGEEPNRKVVVYPTQ